MASGYTKAACAVKPNPILEFILGCVGLFWLAFEATGYLVSFLKLVEMLAK